VDTVLCGRNPLSANVDGYAIIELATQGPATNTVPRLQHEHINTAAHKLTCSG
jgi:hypothetical protein